MLIVRAAARCVALMMCGVVVLLARAAGAQTTAQFPVQFDFLTPGARSMALGGAYLGAADDATASFTNPGGLAFFGSRQFSGEFRIRSLDTPFLSSGRISGAVTGRGEDTVAGPVFGTSVDTSANASFLAVVFPIPAKRISVAAYRHVLADIDNSFFSRGSFERVTFFGQTTDENREQPRTGTRAVQITDYGGSVAYEWGSFGLGGGVALSVFRLDSDFAKHGFETDIFSAPDLDLVSSTAIQDGDDVSMAGNVGVLWRAHPKLSVGATFRRGPSFDFSQQDLLIGGGGLGFDRSCLTNPVTVTPSGDSQLLRSGHFKVPDTWGLGISWSGLPHTRVLFDYDRVQYSQLRHDFIDFQAISSCRPEQLVLDDANEWHGGLEYRARWFGRDMAVRGGAWWDPDHSVRYVPTAAHDEVDTLYEAVLPGGESVMHYTFGAALAISGNVLDAAADLSSRTRSVTVSFLYRF